MEWTFSLENISAVAEDLWTKTGNKTIIAFHGSMGAGKTTFIHALCEVKGVKDVVGSPTFSIINEYEYFPDAIVGDGMKKIIYHIDLFRLKDEEEVLRAGVEDYLYSGHTCLVEWPEKAAGIFPNETVHAQIELIDDKTRRLKIDDI